MFKKAIVLEIFPDINLFSNHNLYDLFEYYGITNPNYMNYHYMPDSSLICIEPNIGSSSGNNSPKIYFPLLSHVKLPIKVGEWVWVLDDNDGSGTSYWVSRIVGNKISDDVNFTHYDRNYTQNQNKYSLINGLEDTTNSIDTDKKVGRSLLINPNNKTNENEYEFIMKNSFSEKFIQKEAIPKIFKRPDEHLIEGSNNSYILLGTDRTENEVECEIKGLNDINFLKKSGKKYCLITGKETQNTDFYSSESFTTFKNKEKKENIGCIDIVAGKNLGEKYKKFEIKSIKSEYQGEVLWEESEKIRNTNKKIKDYFNDVDKPNFKDDLSRVYVSMKSKVDKNFKLNFSENIDKSNACIALKSDQLRLIARKDIKLIVQESDDTPEDKCAAILIKQNGDIVIVPSKEGVIKLGGEDADKAILCSPQGTNVAGKVLSQPIVSSMGGSIGAGAVNGVFATKILIK